MNAAAAAADNSDDDVAAAVAAAADVPAGAEVASDGDDDDDANADTDADAHSHAEGNAAIDAHDASELPEGAQVQAKCAICVLWHAADLNG